MCRYIAANNKLTGNYKQVELSSVLNFLPADTISLQFISAALKKGVTKGSLIRVKASYKVSKAVVAPKKAKVTKKKAAPKKK